MTGMAEAAAARKDWNNVIAWGRKAWNVSPENPEIPVLVGDAYAAQGKKREAEQQYELLRQLAASFPRIYDRHWIEFLADHGRDLDAALALARKDLQLRHDSGAYVALAAVQYKRGALQEAKQAMTKALQDGHHDVDTWQLAADIARATGDTAAAKKHLARAQSKVSLPL
jgi:tetratricopeptide (TPR) repeat protein